MQSKSHHADPYIPAQLDVVVHMGAGRCRELDYHLAAKPKKVLLIEADPQLAESLEARTADLSQVQVTCAAVAGERRAAQFQRYNLPDVGGLRAASGLLELFPGLRTLERIAVETTPAPELVGPLQLDPARENLLVVDVPAEELAVLQALQQAEQLHLFRHLHVHCGRESLYERSQPASRVVEWLRDQGFDLIDEDDSNDPDRPRLMMQRNAMVLQNRALSSQIFAFQRELNKVATERDQHVKRLTDQFATERALLEQVAAALKEELNQSKKLVEDRTKQLSDVTAAKAVAEKVADTLQQKVKRLETENAEITARQRMMNEELVKGEAQIELIKDLLLREPGL